MHPRGQDSFHLGEGGLGRLGGERGGEGFGIFKKKIACSQNVPQIILNVFSLGFSGMASPPLMKRFQVTTRICCVLGWPDRLQRVVRTMTMAFIPDVRVVVGYGQAKSHPSSHRCCYSDNELDYPKKNSPLPVACLFFWAVTPTALSLVT